MIGQHGTVSSVDKVLGLVSSLGERPDIEWQFLDVGFVPLRTDGWPDVGGPFLGHPSSK